MAARPRRMNVDEALAEIFVDRDSDLSDESDQESEDVWELSGNSSESDNEEENESVEEDDPIDASDSESEEDNVRANNERQRRGRGYPRGPARGGLGAARAGPVRARGGRGAVRAGRGTARGARGVRGVRGARVDPAQQAALEAQWVSVDREPNVPAFTGNSGIKAPLPNNPSTGDILSLFLTDEFFDILVEQTNLYAAQYKRNNPNLPPHSRAHEWFDTARPEMKQFITLSLLMGILVLNESSNI